MRAFLVHLALLGFLSSAFCQNSVTTKAPPPQTPEIERWNLNKYIYSHTQYKTGRNDKPVIDFEALDNWQGVGENQDVEISNDGKYFAYTVVTGTGIPYYARKKPDSLIVQSTVNSWRQSFSGAMPGFFAADSKQYIFKDKETLYFLKLGGSDNNEVIKDVSSYQLPPDQKKEWLAYQLKGGEVLLKNLITGNREGFDSISQYAFDKSGKWLVCQENNEGKDIDLYNLKNKKSFQFPLVESYSIDEGGNSIVIKTIDGGLSFANLSTAKEIVIFNGLSGQTINNIALDCSGSQVVFTVKDANKMNSIWYYKIGMEKAVRKVGNREIGADLLINEQVTFTDNNRYIKFSMQPKQDLRKPMADAVNLDVWTYSDPMIQFEKSGKTKKSQSSSFILNVENNKIVTLENEGENLYLLQGEYAIVKKMGNSLYGDRFWEKGYDKDSNWLVSLINGVRTLLPTMAGQYNLWFSPGGNYIVYFDKSNCHYFSYDIYTHKSIDISNGGDFCWRSRHVNVLPKQSIGPAAWIEKDNGLLVYDNYDIWQLDLSGKKQAINLTNGYGSLNDVRFSLSSGDRHAPLNIPIITVKDILLLKAFDLKSKYDGFCRMAVGKKANPEILYMGPYFFEDQRDIEGVVVGSVLGMQPLKAIQGNIWIVKRQSTTEAPNYFVTKDFKSYRQLTYQEPQKQYNWYSAELISFSQLDGTISQGILYKPENFDSSRKYPVIFSFYGALSDRLYQYLDPAYINTPSIFDSPAWLLSHGYLVFMPDIYQTAGQWGPSAVNTIDGAAKYLSKLPYVDSSHLGAVGHSNSGVLGFYLLTHSHSFAAMCVGSGSTDMIGTALSSSKSLEYFEVGHQYVPGYGTDLWQHKAAWIDQTSVLHADRVTSPLLIFQNKADGAFQSATEMFIALRRLKKPVWWLQYDNGDHVLHKLRDLKDFTIRYTQFFDHYLKGAPLPAWMVKGIPYELKGVESKYELESD